MRKSGSYSQCCVTCHTVILFSTGHSGIKSRLVIILYLTVAQPFLSEDSQTFFPPPGLDCCALSSIVSIGTIAGRIVVFQIFPFCLVMPSLSSPGCSGSVITALRLLTQEAWGVQSGQVAVLASSRWNCVSRWNHCSFRLCGLQNSRA